MSSAAVAASLCELLWWLHNIIAGWHYILSASYRERVHLRWRSRSPVYAAVEIIGGVVSCALSIVALYFLVHAVLG